SSELRESEPIRYFQAVFILRGNGRTTQDRERHRSSRNCQHRFALHRQDLLWQVVVPYAFTSRFIFKIAESLVGVRNYIIWEPYRSRVTKSISTSSRSRHRGCEYQYGAP